MSSPALSLPMVAVAPAHERKMVAERDVFAPSEPLLWVYGRLVYADSPTAPQASRLVARLRKIKHFIWCDVLRQPTLSNLDSPVIHDQRGSYGSRCKARSYCKDEMDYIHAVPFGVDPLGDELWLNPTFCRPYLNRDRAKDAKHARTYTANLKSQMCAELAEELDFYKTELERLRRFTGDIICLAERADLINEKYGDLL